MMSNSQFILAISVIAALLVIPLIVAGLVRWLIKDEPPEVETVAVEPPSQFNSLRDFWESNVPHLLELRDRIIKAFVGIMIGAALGSYFVFAQPFGTPIIDFLAQHFLGESWQQRLQTVGTAELFVSYMSLALVIGVAVAMPVLVYQIVAFFAPGLYANEKRVVFTALPFVFELFVAGLVFGWLFTVPSAINFLANFGSNSKAVQIQPTVSDFLDIISRLLLWNGVIFELPAIIYLLARIGVVNAQMLSRTRRYAIVVIVIIAAVITPTGDPFNLMLLAVPMYALYEMGIFLARLVPKKQDPLTPAGAGD